MKKILLLAFLTVLLSDSYGQKVYFWLDVGLKADYGVGMHLNQYLLNDADSEPKLGSSYGFGGKFGFNFADYHAFTIDGMYHYTTQKNNMYNPIISDKTLKTLKYNSIDIYGMYRLSRNLNYIELGVKYSILSKMTEEYDFSAKPIDATKLYQENLLSPVLGIGFNILGSDAFTILAGFRFSYGLKDFVSEDGKAINAFILPSVSLKEYEETHRLFAQFVVEMNFGLGYYAKSTCGKRPKFFSF